jgi:hypothetical protein
VVVIELLGNILPHLINFLLLLQFQLLHQIKCCCFVILHVSVPSTSEFLVLQSLCIFNTNEFSLLSQFHIVQLSLLLITTPSVKYLFEFICHHIISIFFVSLSQLIHYTEKSNDSLIRQEINPCLREQCSVFLSLNIND